MSSSSLKPWDQPGSLFWTGNVNDWKAPHEYWGCTFTWRLSPQGSWPADVVLISCASRFSRRSSAFAGVDSYTEIYISKPKEKWIQRLGLSRVVSNAHIRASWSLIREIFYLDVGRQTNAEVGNMICKGSDVYEGVTLPATVWVIFYCEVACLSSFRNPWNPRTPYDRAVNESDAVFVRFSPCW